jgi:hypothetical protein
MLSLPSAPSLMRLVTHSNHQGKEDTHPFYKHTRDQKQQQQTIPQESVYYILLLLLLFLLIQLFPSSWHSSSEHPATAIAF